MLDEKVKQTLEFVKTYAPNITHWKILKREILNNLPIEKRRLFSKRDPKTKKPNFNDFESQVCNLWEEVTGNKVIISNDVEKKNQ